jgi:hypothetical protein
VSVPGLTRPVDPSSGNCAQGHRLVLRKSGRRFRKYPICPGGRATRRRPPTGERFDRVRRTCSLVGIGQTRRALRRKAFSPVQQECAALAQYPRGADGWTALVARPQRRTRIGRTDALVLSSSAVTTHSQIVLSPTRLECYSFSPMAAAILRPIVSNLAQCKSAHSCAANHGNRT